MLYISIESGNTKIVVLISRRMKRLKIHVDQDLCISCGLCISTCEEVFVWNTDEKAGVKISEITSKQEEAVQEAIDGCPTEAIKKD